MLFLVTGANGFLGREVVAAASRGGHTVRALVRPGRGTAWMDTPGVQVLEAELNDPAALAAAAAGVDVVIHLAMAMNADEDTQRAVAVDGTRMLIEVAADAGVTRLVLASSFSVYAAAAQSPFTEDTAVESAELSRRASYARVKLEQETLASELCGTRGVQLCVLRPGMVWGAGHADAANAGFDLGPLRVVVSGKRPVAMTYVAHCAEAFVAAATLESTEAREVFNIVDDATTAAAAVSRRRPGAKPTIGVPRGLLLGVAHVASGLAGCLGQRGRLPGLLIPARVRARFAAVSCEARRAREVLGWAPACSFEQQWERLAAQGVSDG